MEFRTLLVNAFVFLASLNFIKCTMNMYDGELRFECPDGHYIYEINSVHSNRKEDRQWTYYCRQGIVDIAKCDWTQDYVNVFDQPMNWNCPGDGVVVGAQSYHDNRKEDRQWKFKCCEVS